MGKLSPFKCRKKAAVADKTTRTFSFWLKEHRVNPESLWQVGAIILAWVEEKPRWEPESEGIPRFMALGAKENVSMAKINSNRLGILRNPIPKQLVF